MAAIYCLCAITGVLSVLIVYLENKGVFALKYVLKTVASLCFVLIGVLCLIKSDVFYGWKALVLTALILGMLGDIFLSSDNVVPDKKSLGLLNISGGAFFLVGHIIYVVWLMRFVDGFNLWLLFIVFGLPALIALLSVTGVFKTGKLLLPVMVYAAFLGLMLAAAVNTYIAMPEETVAAYIVSAGALFTFSDLMLAYYNFGHKEQTFIKYAYMPAYYAAQILFALTILF